MQILWEPVDDPAARPGLFLPVQDVPADRPVQLQQLTVGRCPGRPHLRATDPGFELLEQLGVAGPAPAAAHSHPPPSVAQGGGQPSGYGGGPGCTTPRPAWLSHTSRELIWSAARTCSTAPSPAPADARLLALPSAAVAAFWLVWPLTTATGPQSGSAGSASTTNQRDRPLERTTTGTPPTNAVTPVATAAAPAAVPLLVAVPWLVATGSAGPAGAGATEAEGAGVVVLPSAR